MFLVRTYVTSIETNEKDVYGLNIPGQQKYCVLLVELPFYLPHMDGVDILSTIQMRVNRNPTESGKNILRNRSICIMLHGKTNG